MKKYEKPEINMVLLKTEERLAASSCTCSGTVDGTNSTAIIKWHLTGGI